MPQPVGLHVILPSRHHVKYSKEDTVLGESGHPLRLYHGTCRDFTGFTIEVMRSTGVHFGCHDQANHFADQEGARVFPVFLRAKHILDVRSDDFGWRYPNQTLFVLQFRHIISSEDTIKLVGESRNSSAAAWYADNQIAADEPKCKELNRQIEKLIEQKGYDCVLYSNKQEPSDGRARDAYLVLYPEQIVSAITGEVLG
jgi:hypothetical protein